MIFMLSSFLLLSGVLCSPFQVDVDLNPTPINPSEYRLPGESRPTFYDCRFFIDPDVPNTFSGSVSIRVIPNRATSEFVLHAMQMSITTLTVYSEQDPSVNVAESYTVADNDTHLLKITLNTITNALQPHVIHIDYVGLYAPDMFGVYQSSYTNENNEIRTLVTSQLQPTFARRAFPCYDEPSYKAIFRITIYAPEQFTTVLSNMEKRQQSLRPDVSGYVRHEFEDTVIQSSYLIAILVSDFDHIHNEDDPIYHSPFKVFSRPGTLNTATFAMEFGQQNLLALEQYTEMPYALSKMDKVAVPDFAAGAMENWGLVIYREARLLVQDGVTTTSIKQAIASIICHENMHMWFGNEVSPMWWSYTWLNEGFANFFQNYATDLVLPSWRMMEQYVIVMQNVMQADAVLGINPMTSEVNSPTQVLGNFNGVAYQKSGSVIRMLQHCLTAPVFRSGLQYYLKDNRRSAATPEHLYAGLQLAANEAGITLPNTVANILNNWVNEGGFPVVMVAKQSPSANSLSFKQYRYLTDTSQSSNTRWFVPLNWVLSSDPNFEDTSPMTWMGTGVTATHRDIHELAEAEWYIINKQQTGYYRVCYDNDNWRALARKLNSDSFKDIHLLNRAQLVDDSFNLARTNLLDYSIMFKLISYLARETDYVPWAAANAGISYLNNVLQGSSVYPQFQRFVIDLTANVYESLGFTAAANEEHVAAFHRTIVLNLNCNYGNEDCLNTAQGLLQSFIDNPNQPLNPDIQDLVYCSGLRNGDPEDFDFIWNRYLTTQDHTEQSTLLTALGCTGNREKLDGYLNQVISEDSQIREQDRHTVLVATINSGPENMEIAFEFIRNHFTDIQSSVQSLSGTRNILDALSRALSTDEHLRLLNEFVEQYADNFSAADIASTNAALENLQATRSWVQTNIGVVDEWLRDNVPGSAPSITANLMLPLLTIAIMYFFRK